MGKISSKKGAEKVVLNELGEPMFRRIMDDYGNETQDFTIESKGFVKELEVSLIVKREYFSERSFTDKVAYFLTTYKLKMPKDRYLEFVYFYYEKGFSNVCIRNFDTSLTTSINIMNPQNQKEFGIKAISKKRITVEKAQSLMRDGLVLPQISNYNGEFGTTISY
jgi:hypothetical protein